jgi:hypothetical protein
MIQDITVYTDAQKIPAPFTAPETVEPLRVALSAVPGVKFVSIRRDTLGGEYRASLFVLLSLDAREDWSGGIYNNSRHLALTIHANGNVEALMRCHRTAKFRAGKSKDHAHMVARVAKWAAETLNAGKV